MKGQPGAGSVWLQVGDVNLCACGDGGCVGRRGTSGDCDPETGEESFADWGEVYWEESTSGDGDREHWNVSADCWRGRFAVELDVDGGGGDV